MGLKGITLDTPPEEEAHILAEDDAAIYQSIFGEDGVFTIGDRMKATVINNNQVRVSNGVICVGGHIARTVYGDYSDMTIENGEISKNRNDIITAAFSTTGEKGIDKFKIEVKKGTPGVVAEDPELTKENLYEGGKLRELPLWRVKLEGINIIGVEQMFKIIPKIPDLEKMIESLNGKLTERETIKTVTLPFTALKNGVCVCIANPSQSNSYSYIWDGSAIVGAGSCTNGAQYSFPFLVEKGKTYSVKDSSNIKKNITKYI